MAAERIFDALRQLVKAVDPPVAGHDAVVQESVPGLDFPADFPALGIHRHQAATCRKIQQGRLALLSCKPLRIIGEPPAAQEQIAVQPEEAPLGRATVALSWRQLDQPQRLARRRVQHAAGISQTAT